MNFEKNGDRTFFHVTAELLCCTVRSERLYLRCLRKLVTEKQKNGRCLIHLKVANNRNLTFIVFSCMHGEKR